MKKILTLVIALISISINAQTWLPKEGAKYTGATEVTDTTGYKVLVIDENKNVNHYVSPSLLGGDAPVIEKISTELEAIRGNAYRLSSQRADTDVYFGAVDLSYYNTYFGSNETQKTGFFSFTTGAMNTNLQPHSFVTGFNNSLNDENPLGYVGASSSSIIGNVNMVNNSYATHVKGLGNRVEGIDISDPNVGVFVEGISNIVSDTHNPLSNVIVNGKDNVVSGVENSVIIGNTNRTFGDRLNDTEFINNNNIYLFGEGLAASKSGITVLGRYNTGEFFTDSKNMLIIGNGTSPTDRSDAVIVTENSIHLREPVSVGVSISVPDAVNESNPVTLRQMNAALADIPTPDTFTLNNYKETATNTKIGAIDAAAPHIFISDLDKQIVNTGKSIFNGKSNFLDTSSFDGEAIFLKEVTIQDAVNANNPVTKSQLETAINNIVIPTPDTPTVTLSDVIKNNPETDNTPLFYGGIRVGNIKATSNGNIEGVSSIQFSDGNYLSPTIIDTKISEAVGAIPNVTLQDVIANGNTSNLLAVFNNGIQVGSLSLNENTIDDKINAKIAEHEARYHNGFIVNPTILDATAVGKTLLYTENTEQIRFETSDFQEGDILHFAGRDNILSLETVQYIGAEEQMTSQITNNTSIQLINGNWYKIN